jgi:sulfur carrier protein
MEQHSGSAEARASGQASQTEREATSASVSAPASPTNPAGGEAMTLTVNGEARSCPEGLMLPQVLEALGYRPQLVVVEFNGTILPRQRWPEQPVGESDVLEVVTIVGGGS